jgi:uncharacterized protein involved in exopolysaccharide biosynthesis
VYAASVRIAIDPEPTAPLQFTKGQNDAPPADAMQTQREILESRELARRTIVRAKLFDEAEFRAPAVTPTARILALLRLGATPGPPAPAGATDDARTKVVLDGFQSRMSVVPLPFTRLIDVVFESSDPALAARAANAIAETFVVQDLDTRLESMKGATTWLGQRLEEQRARVEASESALQAYKEQQNALAVEDRQNIVVQKLSDLNAAVTKAKTDRFVRETTYRQIEKAQNDPAQLETIPVIAANSAIQQLRAELAAQTRQQAVLSQQYGDLHPEMLKVRSAIEAATEGIERETTKAVELAKNEYLGSVENERRLVGALEEQKKEALLLNRQDLEYGRLQREADANRRLYDALLAQTRQAGITGEFKQSSIRIVDSRRTADQTHPPAAHEERGPCLGHRPLLRHRPGVRARFPRSEHQDAQGPAGRAQAAVSGPAPGAQLAAAPPLPAGAGRSPPVRRGHPAYPHHPRAVESDEHLPGPADHQCGSGRGQVRHREPAGNHLCGSASPDRHHRHGPAPADGPPTGRLPLGAWALRLPRRKGQAR